MSSLNPTGRPSANSARSRWRGSASEFSTKSHGSPPDSERTYHERYLESFRWLGERNDELAQAFNDPRRSQMLWQLAAIHAYGLLEPDEFARFTPQTRERIQRFAKETR